ncbi:unnamed protein product [Symbiodinium natans]|uniref:Uncharacterized protein n=1 Tax=Symbiodinium natans TaxID=878477 RepID=A0A812SJS6_9DINO|nr:unnamed protein product [Symbiodinium natans]
MCMSKAWSNASQQCPAHPEVLTEYSQSRATVRSENESLAMSAHKFLGTAADEPHEQSLDVRQVTLPPVSPGAGSGSATALRPRVVFLSCLCTGVQDIGVSPRLPVIADLVHRLKSAPRINQTDEEIVHSKSVTVRLAVSWWHPSIARYATPRASEGQRTVFTSYRLPAFFRRAQPGRAWVAVAVCHREQQRLAQRRADMATECFDRLIIEDEEKYEATKLREAMHQLSMEDDPTRPRRSATPAAVPFSSGTRSNGFDKATSSRGFASTMRSTTSRVSHADREEAARDKVLGTKRDFEIHRTEVLTKSVEHDRALKDRVLEQQAAVKWRMASRLLEERLRWRLKYNQAKGVMLPGR